MDVRTALRDAMARLRAAQVPSHTLAAELLLMHTLGCDRAWLYAHPEAELKAEATEQYEALVKRRAAGTPTQYLTGKQEFWGLEFHVEPGVLIPRPETEHVVEVALERLGPPPLDDPKPRGAGLRIADVGTGSGCIAVALAKELPGAEIVATDISAEALEIAKRNAQRLHVRVHFFESNLLEIFLPGSQTTNHEPRNFHLIVSNPPYIGRKAAGALPAEVRGHEPDAALFGGEMGSEVYPRLIEQAAALLSPGGILVLELGHDSLPRVYPLLERTERARQAAPLRTTWHEVRITHDLAGVPRVISALRS